MQRVVITGIGAVTPLANTFEGSWDCIKQGKSGIRVITKCDTSGIPWRMAGEIRNLELDSFLTNKESMRVDPFVHYAVAAAHMAAEDAGLISRFSSIISHPSLSGSCAVIIGSSRGGISTIERSLLKRIGTNAKPSAYIMPATTISMAASCVAQKLGCREMCLGISNACASGMNAVGEAFRSIQQGSCALALAGGTEAPICRICLEGYGVAGALSKISSASASRPFDKMRDGFLISEGACVLVLEEYEAALQRNATIYAEISGFSCTSDAFHMTKPSADGESDAIRKALIEAGISPAQVDYVSAHGTSTIIGDRVEAEALSRVFKDHPKVPVSGLKSMTGHMLAASGPFELACVAMSIKEGVIPPTINLNEKDAGCKINVITQAMRAPIEIALSNSFGFGGVNAVIIIKKCK